MAGQDPYDEAEHAYRNRRRRRTAITLAVVIAGLAFAFSSAASYYQESGPKPQPCTTVAAPEPTADPLEPADVTLNVYNATKRSGIASAAAKTARERRFVVEKVANDPDDAEVGRVAIIRYGPDGKESAKLLATHLPEGVKLVKIKREGDVIDLVLGEKWKKFGPVPVEPEPEPTLPPC